MTNLDSIVKSRGITLPTKFHLVKAMIFPVVMYECESRVIKKDGRWRHLWTMVLEKTLKSPLDCKEIQSVNPKGNQPWIFTGRTNAEAEALILWSSYAKNRLTGIDPDLGRDWGQEEKGTTEDEIVGWYQRLNGHLLKLSGAGADSRKW